MNKFKLIIISLFCLGLHATQAQFNADTKTIRNGGLHLDTQGNVINAHGSGFLQHGDTWYWVGENRKNGILVSLYKSKDLINWDFCADLLTRESHPDLAEANLERPKIIYNDSTKQFVMWMHYEKKSDYSLARAAVAYSDDIEKPFTYIKSFRPLNHMSRDCTLYKDDDGKAYFFSAARENYDMHQYLLTPDYKDIQEMTNLLWPGGHREAPAIIKKGENYFLMTSGCTGWAPNQAKYAVAKSIRGPWSELKNIGNETTFESQSTYILKLKQGKQEKFVYIGDRWDGKKYFNSRYIFLPLEFPDAETMELKWKDEININNL